MATPVFSEKLICGQDYQTMSQISLPAYCLDMAFVDMFRLFLSRNVRSVVDVMFFVLCPVIVCDI